MTPKKLIENFVIDLSEPGRWHDGYFNVENIMVRYINGYKFEVSDLRWPGSFEMSSKPMRDAMLRSRT